MKAVVAAFAANLGIAVIKFVAFLLTGSASMLAESVHSVADTGNEVLLLVGRGRSSRPPSDEHPFGFGRERYFYGFVVSVMLFTVGAAFSVYDGVHKMLNPEPVHSPLVAFAVLILSAVLEGFSLRTGIREANRVRGGRSWGAFIRRSKAPELPVVLLEDMAALIGLVFAFAGVALSVLTSNSRWDGAGSLGIGVLLATAAAILAVEMKSLLIGESASPEMQRMIIAAIEDGPDLARVIHLRTVHISPDSVLVVAKVAVRESDSATQITSGIDAAENRVRAAVPIAKTIYLEPDIYRPSMVDQTDPSIRTVVHGRPPRPSRLPRRDRPQPPSLPPGTAGNRTRNRYVASLSCWPRAGIRCPFRRTSTQESHVAHEPQRSWKIRLSWNLWYPPVARIFREGQIFHANPTRRGLVRRWSATGAREAPPHGAHWQEAGF